MTPLSNTDSLMAIGPKRPHRESSSASLGPSINLSQLASQHGPPSRAIERATIARRAGQPRSRYRSSAESSFAGASFVCFVFFVAAHPSHSRTAWQATAKLLRELDSTSRKMLGMIGEGLSFLIRQPWPAPDQASQLRIVCIQGRIQLGANSGFRLSIPTDIESSIAHSTNGTADVSGSKPL